MYYGQQQGYGMHGGGGNQPNAHVHQQAFHHGGGGGGGYNFAPQQQQQMGYAMLQQQQQQTLQQQAYAHQLQQQQQLLYQQQQHQQHHVPQQQQHHIMNGGGGGAMVGSAQQIMGGGGVMGAGGVVMHHSGNGSGGTVGGGGIVAGGGGGAMMGAGGAVGGGGVGVGGGPSSQSLAFKHLSEMYSPETREQAMQEMAKIRDHEKDMGLYIWHSTGIMAILVQELIAVYPLLNPLTLTMTASSRVSNALTLLQCVASHNDTRRRFLDSQMVNFLLPFLSSASHNKALECARLTALGVIGGLVKNDDTAAIESLLQLEIVPVCLRIMESGSELCKTLATFVIQKILSAEKGLEYMCNPKYPARFTAVATVLKTMVNKDNREPLTTRLLRLILRCYSNFTNNRAARDALKTCLPDELRNNTHLQLIESDQTVKKVWRELLNALDDAGVQQQNSQQSGQYTR